MDPQVAAVAAWPAHDFSKPPQPVIRLLAGLGVEGDAHCGATMRHRGRLPRQANEPNTRQVHLVHAELHDLLRAQGFDVGPGAMGENVTTRGVDLLGLPTGTRLHLGAGAVVRVTGLRNPCGQLEGLAPGLREATLERGPDGEIVRRLAGIMAVVEAGGDVRPGDPIRVVLPQPPHTALVPV